jgi:hypothetical protein
LLSEPETDTRLEATVSTFEETVLIALLSVPEMLDTVLLTVVSALENCPEMLLTFPDKVPTLIAIVSISVLRFADTLTIAVFTFEELTWT